MAQTLSRRCIGNTALPEICEPPVRREGRLWIAVQYARYCPHIVDDSDFAHSRKIIIRPWQHRIGDIRLGHFWVLRVLEFLLRDASAFERFSVFFFVVRGFIFEVAVGQVVVIFGVRVGVGGESLIDGPCLSFWK